MVQLTYPTDVAVDASGNVYIADYGNFVIRQVTTDGIIHTFAGNNTPGFSGDGGAPTSAALYQPFGVAMDSSGNVYISEYGDSRIRKVTSGTSARFPRSLETATSDSPATAAAGPRPN